MNCLPWRSLEAQLLSSFKTEIDSILVIEEIKRSEDSQENSPEVEDLQKG